MVNIGWEHASHRANSFQFGRKAPQRFFLKPGASKEIIFVDDHPAVFTEHQIWINRKPQHYTCLGENCPLCKKGNTPSKVFALTAVDKTPWTDRGGNVHDNNLVMFVGKMNVAGILRQEKEKRRYLSGMRYRVTRSEKTAPVVGDDFNFISASIQESSRFVSIDYNDVFAPLTHQELEDVAAQI